MSFISIPAMYTADPADVWTPKSSFFPFEPFAINMHVQISQDLIDLGLLFDAVFQMVNPRRDPFDDGWWIADGANFYGLTVDSLWNNGQFNWTNFGIWFHWDQYNHAVSHLLGPEKVNGVFYVQGTISVQGTSLFAHSDKYWYKVRPRVLDRPNDDDHDDHEDDDSHRP